MDQGRRNHGGKGGLFKKIGAQSTMCCISAPLLIASSYATVNKGPQLAKGVTCTHIECACSIQVVSKQHNYIMAAI